MLRPLVRGLAVALTTSGVLLAQDVIVNRLPAMAVRGPVIEVTCFKHLGAAKATTPEQITCAKEALAKGGTLGILTEGDGMFKIVGALAANNYAKLVPYIGKQVEMTGAEVIISNNYDYRSYEAQKVTPVK